MVLQTLGLGVTLLDNASPGLNRLTRNFGLLSTQLNKSKMGLDQTAAGLNKTGDQLYNSMVGLTSGLILLNTVGNRLNQFYAKSVEHAKNWQSSLADIKFALNLNNKELKYTADVIFKKYSQGLFDVTDATKAYYDIATAGIAGIENTSIIGKGTTKKTDITAEALKGAQLYATFARTSLEEGGRFVRDLIFKTGITFTEMLDDGTNKLTRALDIMSKSTVLTALKPNEMATLLNSTRTAMKDIGANLQDMLAITGTLMSAGQSAQEAGMAYNAMARKFAMDSQFEVMYEKLYMQNRNKDQQTTKQKWELILEEGKVVDRRLKELNISEKQSKQAGGIRGTIGVKRKMTAIDLIFGSDGAMGTGLAAFKKALYDKGKFRNQLDFYKIIYKNMEEGISKGRFTQAQSQGLLQAFFGESITRSAFKQLSSTGRTIIGEDVFKVDEWGTRIRDEWGNYIKLFYKDQIVYGLDAAEYISKAAEDSKGYAERYAEIQKKTFEGATKQWEATKKNFMTIMGTTVLPIFGWAMGVVTGFLRSVTAFLAKNQGLAKILGIIGLGATALISLTGVILVGRSIIGLTSMAFSGMNKATLKSLLGLNLFTKSIANAGNAATKSAVQNSMRSSGGWGADFFGFAKKGSRYTDPKTGRFIGKEIAQGMITSQRSGTVLAAGSGLGGWAKVSRFSGLFNFIKTLGPVVAVAAIIAGGLLYYKNNIGQINSIVENIKSLVESFVDAVFQIPNKFNFITGLVTGRYKRDFDSKNMNTLIADKGFLGTLNKTDRTTLGTTVQLYKELLAPYMEAMGRKIISGGGKFTADDEKKLLEDAMTTREEWNKNIEELVKEGRLTKGYTEDVSNRLGKAHGLLEDYLKQNGAHRFVGGERRTTSDSSASEIKLNWIGKNIESMTGALMVGGGIGFILGGLPGAIVGGIVGGLGDVLFNIYKGGGKSKYNEAFTGYLRGKYGAANVVYNSDTDTLQVKTETNGKKRYLTESALVEESRAFRSFKNPYVEGFLGNISSKAKLKQDILQKYGYKNRNLALTPDIISFIREYSSSALKDLQEYRATPGTFNQRAGTTDYLKQQEYLKFLDPNIKKTIENVNKAITEDMRFWFKDATKGTSGKGGLMDVLAPGADNSKIRQWEIKTDESGKNYLDLLTTGALSAEEQTSFASSLIANKFFEKMIEAGLPLSYIQENINNRDKTKFGQELLTANDWLRPAWMNNKTVTEDQNAMSKPIEGLTDSMNTLNETMRDRKYMYFDLTGSRYGTDNPTEVYTNRQFNDSNKTNLIMSKLREKMDYGAYGDLNKKMVVQFQNAEGKVIGEASPGESVVYDAFADIMKDTYAMLS